MCRSKMAIDASEPIPTTPPPNTTATTTPRPVRTRTPRSSAPTQTTQSPKRPSPKSPFAKSPTKLSPSSPSTNSTYYPGFASASGSDFRLNTSVTTNSASTRTSLSAIHLSLPEHAYVYDFSEIRSVTKNFLVKRYSTSSSTSRSWRCELNGKDVIIFQRKIGKGIGEFYLKSKLSVICRSHHTSIIKLLGASISNDHIYLVYDFVDGSDLSTCLRNPNNPHFTVLSTWMSRMQIATDLAHGLDYIHNTAGFSISLVHKHINGTGIIITEPSLNARICHFGAAELCSETGRNEGEIIEEELPELRRSDSRGRQFEGVRGYMSPEFKSAGVATQKSDVYSFGVVILELLSGEEPVKYKYDEARGEYRRISVIDAAREAVEGGGDGDETMEGRLRRWVDKRLKDSFPVEVAEKLTRLVLECVDMDPNQRPDMRRVAGKISRLYLESKMWSDRVKLPTDFSVSLAPR